MDKAYSKTLLLPKTKFSLWNDPSKDQAFVSRTCDELYRWQWENAKGPLFVFHDGPPYANGELHIGHALNKILKDIINRYHVSLGHRVHYMPGWDCHGLPIENKVLAKLGKRAQDLSPDVIRIEAEAFAREEMRVQQDQFRQFGVMANWQPESTYRTLDHDYEMRQLQIFQKMVEKGLIYRNYRPVYYSPSSSSALAEAELTYNEKHVSHSVYVAFELNTASPNMSTTLRTLVTGRKNVRLLVWTTTPWTLTANMAIAVNPEMMYKAVAASADPTAPLDIFACDLENNIAKHPEVLGSAVPIAEIPGHELVNATYRSIFSSLHDTGPRASLPILSSSHVTPDSGTGLVHCAPAHGAEDYAVMRSLGLLPSSSTLGSLLCHVDLLGQFTEDVADEVGERAAHALIGKDVLGDGSKAIVELLMKAGALRKVHRYTHRYPYDWRTDKPVIVIATSQWFASTDQIKEDAIAALEDVAFHPAASRNRLESFVRSRSEWCISRQRVWGVPIPAMHHIPTGRSLLDSASLDHILSILQEKRTEYWWKGPVHEFVPPALRDGMDERKLAETWRKGTDTMDVWFDSGTSWSMLDGLYREGGSGNGRTFGADVCLEGSDQHRGWFQSQLLTAIGSATAEERKGVAPYSTLITHGMVLDESGRKMSKSVGNVISPMAIIHGGKDKKKEPEYGTEVLRLWAATVEFTKDMHIGPTLLAQCKETLRKIRNTARFILGVLGDQQNSDKADRKEFGLAERYVMHELYKLEQESLRDYAAFDFPRVVNGLANFASITLSSLYLDITKDCLYADAIYSLERRRVVTVLEQVLNTMTSVMAPILPYVAEEIHEILRSAPGTSVFTKKWTQLDSNWEDSDAERDMNELLRIRSKVLAALEHARQDKKLRSSLEAGVQLTLPESVPQGVQHLIDVLRREESFLKTLFIVSDVSLSAKDYTPQPGGWVYSESLPLGGSEASVKIIVHPATLNKCPRCWAYTRSKEETLCHRCSEVVSVS
ncbi:isoleucyl-tRNA synthetase [Laetiporus sulphureus 93-53]|uniref:Isoleucine--tRNA ligase, mitochondrial n=1 Tax=Laetiporus sulphureus 93-53 TaxID=1314785 RepID=A0A165GFP9_9APHY|nr:isoleucyl-tRNA synthetase [Laetiporus sulphureus 93-53]KZT10283.1 isoleucyl-tRNA synthetase [Laetiporus sulphureus 93-53]